MDREDKANLYLLHPLGAAGVVCCQRGSDVWGRSSILQCTLTHLQWWWLCWWLARLLLSGCSSTVAVHNVLFYILMVLMTMMAQEVSVIPSLRSGKAEKQLHADPSPAQPVSECHKNLRQSTGWLLCFSLHRLRQQVVHIRLTRRCARAACTTHRFPPHDALPGV